MKSPEKGLDFKSNPFFRVNLCLLLQIALGIFTRILQSQTLESETYTTRLGRGMFFPPLLPSRTDEHVSRIPLPSSLLGSCFEKKEKEPKKKGKRTEKERNSVTSLVDHPSLILLHFLLEPVLFATITPCRRKK